MFKTSREKKLCKKLSPKTCIFSPISNTVFSPIPSHFSLYTTVQGMKLCSFDDKLHYLSFFLPTTKFLFVFTLMTGSDVFTLMMSVNLRWQFHTNSWSNTTVSN
uniref:Uncharacterized protein n=1 Tax=Cacopsylla melanoneura TaxID=428564 RepID=A0A8D8QTX3_9HEMI